MLFVRVTEQNRKAEAKTLSEKGKHHGELMVQANQRAAAVILSPQKLSEPTTDTIDLHGLLLQEATNATKAFIESKIRDRKLAMLTIITGQGLHSDWMKGAVIKPAILKLLNENKWQSEPDEKNPGCIRVRL
jgi:DNA-nicking Smr family endonuclease